MAIEGFLDDYSHFVWGLLEVYRASNDRKYLDWAIGLTETVLVHFSDAKGGFFQTDDSSEEMIVRMKEAYDGAIPSGNSVMAMDLVTLGVLTGESKYSEAAEKIFEAFATDIESNPAAYAHLLSAFSRWRRKGRLLALIGADGEEAVVGFQAVAREHYDPDLEIIRYSDIQEIPESLRKGIMSLGSEPRSSAYLCSGTSCEPIRDPSELEKVLASRQRG